MTCKQLGKSQQICVGNFGFGAEMVDPKRQREANVPSLVRVRRKVRLSIISTSFKGTWSS